MQKVRVTESDVDLPSQPFGREWRIHTTKIGGGETKSVLRNTITREFAPLDMYLHVFRVNIFADRCEEGIRDMSKKQMYKETLVNFWIISLHSSLESDPTSP